MAEIKSVTTEAFTMEYCKFGRGKRNLVMLPGLSVQSVLGSAAAVEDGYQLFTKDYTIYLFDRRKEIPSDYSIHDMAKDTVTVIKALGLKDLYIFGASQGGMIAQVIAIEHPELVAKLVLGSTSSHIQESQQAVIDTWIDLAEKKDAKALYRSFAKEIYPPEVYAQYESYFDDVSKTVTEEELARFVILARSIKSFNVTAELEKISCPVLALGVYEDAVLDSDATMEIAENLDYRPDFMLYMYTGYGHAAFDTAPDYKQRVYDFFQK